MQQSEASNTAPSSAACRQVAGSFRLPAARTRPGRVLRAPKPRPRRSRRNMSKLEGSGVGQLPWRGFREHPEPLKGAGAKAFGRNVPRVIMPNRPKLTFQAQSLCPGSACGLAIRAGSTQAQSSGTSVGLGAEVSDCFCCGLTDRAPILSWAPFCGMWTQNGAAPGLRRRREDP